MAVTTIKKYSNRRLYDTEESRYITLDELTDRIKRGGDVRVVDAKSNEDLTQATLVQIVLETKAARLLPVPLLARLIRMQDDALGDFFSRYVSFALEMYLTAKSGAQALSPYVPFATLPFSASNALARDQVGFSPDNLVFFIRTLDPSLRWDELGIIQMISRPACYSGRENTARG